MKSNQRPEHDHTLRKVLSEWQVNATLPPRFQERVWERIERGEEKHLAPGIWTQFTTLLSRPKFAMAYLMIFLLIGVGTGYQRGLSKTAQIKTDLQTRYVQMVDPYQRPR